MTYDLCYRRAAALQKNLHWPRVDFTLYNETFTGKARPTARCKYCRSEHHKAHECVYAPQPLPHSPAMVRDTDNTCYLYNSQTGNQCRFLNIIVDTATSAQGVTAHTHKSPVGSTNLHLPSFRVWTTGTDLPVNDSRSIYQPATTVKTMLLIQLNNLLTLQSQVHNTHKVRQPYCKC